LPRFEQRQFERRIHCEEVRPERARLIQDGSSRRDYLRTVRNHVTSIALESLGVDGLPAPLRTLFG
jgi:hypothetical protein